MAHRAAFMKKRNAESIHHMRVSIRRLRTVINILHLVTADENFERYNQSLRDLAHILGQGRDQDIFIAMLQQIPSSFHHDLDAQEQAVYAIISIRDKFYLQIDAALQAKKLDLLFDNLITIFQSGKYTFQPSYSAAADIDKMILDHIHKSVLKRGRKLGDQDFSQRHQLRISLKYLRYALEFLAIDRAASTTAKPYRKTIERILSHLGAANDAFTASRIARESLSYKNAQMQLMAGMIAGWSGRAIQDSEAVLLKSWQKFKSLSPYWD